MNYYYPYLFNSDKYKSEVSGAENKKELLLSCTTIDSSFPVDIDKLATEFILNTKKNLPMVLANDIESTAIDIDDAETASKMQKNASILIKLGFEEDFFDEIIEPFLGFITKEEVLELIAFIDAYTSEDSFINDLKKDFLVLLKTAKDNQSGLVYAYDTLGGGPEGIKGKGAFSEGLAHEENVPVVRLHTKDKKPLKEMEIKDKLKSNFGKITEFVRSE